MGSGAQGWQGRSHKHPFLNLTLFRPWESTCSHLLLSTLKRKVPVPKAVKVCVWQSFSTIYNEGPLSFVFDLPLANIFTHFLK